MPKGLPKSKAHEYELKQAELNTLVAKGATTFPGTGNPIPKGVAVRSSHGVQIEFMYNGVRHYETIQGKPTVEHVLAAAARRDRILQLIGLNSFDYKKEFPNSPKVNAARQQAGHEGKSTKEKKTTLGEALNDWLVVVKDSVGFNAAKDYEKDVKLLKQIPASIIQDGDARKDASPSKTLAAVAAVDITDVEITRLRNWLLAKPGAKAGTNLSIKRVRNLLTPVRGALERLVAASEIPRNPFNLVKPLKKQTSIKRKSDGAIDQDLDAPLPVINNRPSADNNPEVQPFSPGEVEAILSQLSGQFLNLVTFWFWTGLRTGELIALRWSDIHWESRQMYIRRSLSRGHLKAPKFDKCRWVKLCEPAHSALIEQFKFSDAGDGWVFPNPFTGKMWANESKIRTRFRKAVERAGVRYRRPYNCRHTYASVMLSAGENPLFVAEQMGHKDWDMIVKVYGRWMKDVDQEAGRRVANVCQSSWNKHMALLTSRQFPDEESSYGDDMDDAELCDDELMEY